VLYLVLRTSFPSTPVGVVYDIFLSYTLTFTFAVAAYCIVMRRPKAKR
jgi:hypothetical protein